MHQMSTVLLLSQLITLLVMSFEGRNAWTALFLFHEFVRLSTSKSLTSFVFSGVALDGMFLISDVGKLGMHNQLLSFFDVKHAVVFSLSHAEM